MKEDKELSELSKRFIEILQTKDYSAYQLEKEVPAITSAKVSHIKTGRNQPSREIIDALLEKFTDINKVWLLTGQGQMTITNNKSNEHSQIIPRTSRDKPNYEPPANFMEEIKKIINRDRQEEERIDVTEVYNVHLTTGRVSTLGSSTKIPDILLLNGAFKGCDLVIRHTDPAMNTFFDEESFIGIKRIQEDSYKKLIIPGKCYVIVMHDYILERFLFPGGKKPLLMKAATPERFPDFEIDYDQVVELYLIKGWVQAPKLKST